MDHNRRRAQSPGGWKMKMTEVKSSNIQAVGWDNGILHIRFKNGATYSYEDVAGAEFNALLSAPSVGKHFHAMGIKSRGVKLPSVTGGEK